MLYLACWALGRSQHGLLGQIFPEVTETTISLTENPHELTEDSIHMQRIEQLTVLMYSKNCSSVTDNEARRLMFTHTVSDL